MPRALVVVTTYNQLPLLRRALRGNLRQSTDDFHLTVADDGSRPDTRAFLEELAPAFAARGIGFQHVWQEDRGFRRARVLNEGVRRSPAAPLLVFSDGDCIPPARFVERHLGAHEPRSFHVAGAWRLSQEESDGLGEADVDRGAFEALRPRESLRVLRRKRRQSLWGTRVGRRHRPKILGLNVGVDRALFEEVNGFDERFVHWGLEDSDLRDRLMRLRPKPRVKVLYARNDVWHLWHPTYGGGGDGRAQSRVYYRLARPVRCELGLVHP
jgi:GT2 family glycosyltransferase